MIPFLPSWLGPKSLLAVALALAVLAAYAERRSAAKWHARADQTAAILQNERASSEAAKRTAEADYRSKADAAAVSFHSALADADARLAGYVARNRLRTGAQAYPAGAAEGRNPDVLAVAPAEAVLASLSDLKACNEDYAYAKAAHDWAATLNQKSRD